MITMNEFKNLVGNAVKSIDGVESVEFREITKTNGVIKPAIIPCIKGSNLSPTFYLDDLYELYGKKSIRAVIEFLETTINNIPKLGSVEDLINIDVLKQTLLPKLVNYEKNREKLKDIPHKRILDLAEVYYFTITQDSKGVSTVVVTKELAKKYNLTKYTLAGIASVNLCRQRYQFRSIEETLSDVLGGVEIPPFLVPLSVLNFVNNKPFGAAIITDRDYLFSLYDRLGAYVIIPSSIHEVIILPLKNKIPNFSDLVGIVKTINCNEVDAQDVLSDSVYMYDGELHMFSN